MWTNDVEPMDISYNSWYYLADCGRWHRFEDDPDNSPRSEEIENHYQTNSRTPYMFLNSKIDFSVMLQTDLITGRQRRISRSLHIEKSCSCFSAPPVFWDSFDPALPYQSIPLSPSTPEFKTVANYVIKDGLLNKSIVSISRIQNLDLWEMFCRKKKQLMRIKGVRDISERRLFHGTNVRNVDSICKYNFDLRLAGKHGKAFGKGIYFATYASIAAKYSSRSATSRTHGTNIKAIFLARVIVGEPAVGHDLLIKPDDGDLENSHDCCVDDINHPKIYVIFDPNQIYPEYLIRYISD